MYIVSGATGQTGSVVSQTLLEKGLPVRVIVRSEEKGKYWKDSGADAAVADVRDPDGFNKSLIRRKSFVSNESAERAIRRYVCRNRESYQSI